MLDTVTLPRVSSVLPTESRLDSLSGGSPHNGGKQDSKTRSTCSREEFYGVFTCSVPEDSVGGAEELEDP